MRMYLPSLPCVRWFFFITYVYFPYTHLLLVTEDNLGEYIQFFCYLFAAVIMGIKAMGPTAGKLEKIIKIGLSGILFFIAMEEVDWLSRIFRYQISYIQDKNTYGALNIHNMIALEGINIQYIFYFAFWGVLLPAGEKFFLVTRFPRYQPTFINVDYLLALTLVLLMAIVLQFFSLISFYEFSELILAAAVFYLALKQLSPPVVHLPWMVGCLALSFSYFAIGETHDLRNFNPDRLLSSDLLLDKDYARALSIVERLIAKQKKNIYYYGYLPQDETTYHLLKQYLHVMHGDKTLDPNALRQAYALVLSKINQYQFLRLMLQHKLGKTVALQDYLRLANDFSPIDRQTGVKYPAVVKALLQDKPAARKGLQANWVMLYRSLYFNRPLEK